MNNPFTIEFTLRQHTPIIHFQHEQAGATLRASEVKPKLDRFIMELVLTQNKIVFEPWDVHAAFRQFVEHNAEYKSWLVGKDTKGHLALDYKIKIGFRATTRHIVASKLSGNQPELLQKKGYQVIRTSPYFAQEKELGPALFEKIDPTDNHSQYKFVDPENAENQLRNLSKLGLVSQEEIPFTIHCLNGILLETIKKSIALFFVAENFGTRQSKGFGSFTVAQINDEAVSTDIQAALTGLFDVVYQKDRSNSQERIFETIINDYKLIKAGRGSKERAGYAKSRLFLFFAGKGVRWEKRWIKRGLNPLTKKGQPFEGFKLTASTNPGSPIDIDNTQDWNDKTGMPVQYEFVRALLGLAEIFDFQAAGRKKISVHVDGGDVQRFRSPILFKVIGQDIYLVAKDNLPTAFLHSKNVAFDAYKKEHELDATSKLSLSNPPKIPASFSLKEFLEFCLWQDVSNTNPKDTDVNRITDYKRLK